MKVDLEDVRKAISHIPKQERKALILRDVLELKYKEISQILNVEVNSVGVYIHRARSLVLSCDSSKDEGGFFLFYKIAARIRFLSTGVCVFKLAFTNQAV